MKESADKPTSTLSTGEFVEAYMLNGLVILTGASKESKTKASNEQQKLTAEASDEQLEAVANYPSSEQFLESPEERLLGLKKQREQCRQALAEKADETEESLKRIYVKKIKGLRTKIGNALGKTYTQKAFAADIGVAEHTLQRWEYGSIPRVRQLIAIQKIAHSHDLPFTLDPIIDN